MKVEESPRGLLVLMSCLPLIVLRGVSGWVSGRACSSPCVRSRSVVSDSLRPQGLEPARLLCPRGSPGKNAGVGCHFLLQQILAPLALLAVLLKEMNAPGMLPSLRKMKLL